jgi:hypothetical protein
VKAWVRALVKAWVRAWGRALGRAWEKALGRALGRAGERAWVKVTWEGERPGRGWERVLETAGATVLLRVWGQGRVLKGVWKGV